MAIPGGLHAAPRSLSALMRATRDPQPERWRKTSEQEVSNRGWTEECQGVTHDTRHWFFSSNRNPIVGAPRRGIHRLSSGLRERGFFGVDFTGHEHIGDIDHHDGRIYAAMERPPGILWVDTAFSRHGRATLKDHRGSVPSPQGGSLPWCAINPWNGWLYSSRFGDADQPAIGEVFAYDPDDDFRHVATLGLGQGLKRIQGGCFTPNGHLLLTSDHTYDIHCYSVLNGAHRGRVGIQVDTGDGEEVEGITVRRGVRTDGVDSEVHVVLLDNDFPSGDDVYFKHYSVPRAEDL